ncbi:MAG: hypothetical protein ACKV19_04535 [Verrucomicrobiales bacterium]
MKTCLCLFTLLIPTLAGAAADAVPEAVASLGMLPHQRGGLQIAADERNPFAAKVKEAAKVTLEDTETQESKIRSIFRQLRVTGIRRDRQGRFLALAGDLILRQGEEVKPVLEEQTEVLMVSKIEPGQIELTFVENKDSTQPRVIVLPVRNQVQVSQKLFAQPDGKSSMYVARGRATPTIEEAAEALASSTPTAPARATPIATVTGSAPPAPATPVATTAQAPQRDSLREAAALAGMPPGMALTGKNNPPPSPPATTPPAAAPPAPATPASAAPPPPPAPESAPPPTFQRRRNTPPQETPPAPSGDGVVE